MQETTVIPVNINGDIDTTNAHVTLAGAAALATPLPLKELVSNNRRDQAGKTYLLSTAKNDDTIVSVQFIAMGDNFKGATDEMNRIIGLFGDKKSATTILAIQNGVSQNFGRFLYKSASTPSPQCGGKVLLFSLNLIKLASNG